MDCLPHIHVAALHAPSEQQFRTFTPGLGVLCRKADWLAGAGVYRNSIGTTSKYVMGGYQPLRIGPVAVGAFVGAVDGYRRNHGGFNPMGGLALSWGHVHVIAWPQVKDYSPAGLAVSFTFR